MLRRVVLPDPLGPMIAIVSPASLIATKSVWLYLASHNLNNLAKLFSFQNVL
jgi:hypothetical protein